MADLRRPRVHFTSLLTLHLAVAAPALAGDSLSPGQTAVVSINASGSTNGGGPESDVSSNGRFVVFVASASLVDLPDNGKSQILVRDRKKGKLAIVSAGPGGIANDFCSQPAISSNGRWVVFRSKATNLDGLGNGKQQVFRHDRKTGEIRRVSLGPSTDPANDDCVMPCVSNDGRFVAYLSKATNLSVPPTTGLRSVWLRDSKEGTVENLSVSTTGELADGSSDELSMSANARMFAFTSVAKNLGDGNSSFSRDVYVRDRKTGVTRLVAVPPNGENAGGGWSSYPRISANGRFVAYTSLLVGLTPTDPSPASDVFVEDLKKNEIEGFGVFSQGEWCDVLGVDVSKTGERLAVNILHLNGSVDPLDDTSEVFVIRKTNGATKRASVNSAGEASNGASNLASRIADGGKFVVFGSNATNLGADQDTTVDVFIRRL